VKVTDPGGRRRHGGASNVMDGGSPCRERQTLPTLWGKKEYRPR
jgi:hypothetical protein